MIANPDVQVSDACILRVADALEKDVYKRQKYKVPVIVDSDAHIFYDVGNLDRAKEMLEACEFPKKLILNTKLKGLSYVLNLEREETREKYDHMVEG